MSPAGHLQALSKIHFVSEEASFVANVLVLHRLFLPSLLCYERLKQKNA